MTDASTAPPKLDERGGPEPPASESPESEPPVSESPESEPPAHGWLQRFLDTYAQADPRALGLFRIALGALLFVDVARRWPDLWAHYSNAGWLTNHYSLYRPMSGDTFSIYHAFSSPVAVKGLVAFQLAVNLLLLVGYRTKWMHGLAAILITSLNSRNIMLENGGYVVLNLLTIWSLFLPLGRRFSIDAWLASFRARREGTVEALNDRSLPTAPSDPLTALAVAVLIAQWAVIYYFNVVQKSGTPWRDGTAVYYFFQQDRMVTAFGGWVRHYLPLALMKAMTFAALVMEGAIAMLLVLPFWTSVARMLAWALAIVLHLSIDAVVQLGPFSWAMVIMFVALIPHSFFEWFAARRRERARRCRVHLRSDNAIALSVGRIIKRLDHGENVSFVAATQAPTGELFVVEAGASTPRTGQKAVVSLAKALGFPVLGWPFVRHLLGYSLSRLTRESAKYARFFSVEDLPGSDRVAEQDESELQDFWARTKLWAATTLLGLWVVSAVSQVLIENHAVAKQLKPESRPRWMEAMVFYPRMFQGWSMFAPYPPDKDGRIVVDGVTADGRRLDPLTGKTPSFEVDPWGGYGMNQIWGDFHRRIWQDRFRQYMPGLREFLIHHHEHTGVAEDALVGFKVWYVEEKIVLPDQQKPPITRRLLFSWGSMLKTERRKR